MRTWPDIQLWRVPDYDEGPPEEMVEWLNEFPDWEGDECGIVLFEVGDSQVIIAPGDYLCDVNPGQLAKVEVDVFQTVGDNVVGLVNGVWPVKLGNPKK